MVKIRNRQTGEIREISENDLSKYNINQKPTGFMGLVSSLGEKTGAQEFGRKYIKPIGKISLPKILQPLATQTIQGVEKLKEAPIFKETAGAFTRGFIPTANIGLGGTPEFLQKPETPIGKSIQATGAITGALAPSTVGEKALGLAGKTISPVIKPIGKTVKGGLKRLGEKFMNIFIKSEHGKDVIKYVPNIFKAKNLEEAQNIIRTAKQNLGKQLEVEAGIVTPPKNKIIAALNKGKQKYVGVNKQAVEIFDNAISKVKMWKPQKFQKLQTKKQILAELGASAYKTGKSATAKANRTVADVLRPFLEKTAIKEGTNIREINRTYNTLREAEKAVIKAAKSYAKSKPIDWLDIAPLAFGPKGLGIVGVRRALKTPKTYQKGSELLTKLGERTIKPTEKQILKVLTKLGITGLNQ